jgi:hypothetical protein
MEERKNLVRIKKAHELTGTSVSFFKKLLKENRLQRYKIDRCTYVSLVEFEKMAQPEVR